MDVIENSEILADGMIAAAAFLLSREVERRGYTAYNKYGRCCSDWQQQDKSNLGCKQQVGRKEKDETELSSRKTLQSEFMSCFATDCTLNKSGNGLNARLKHTHFLKLIDIC